MLKTFCLLIGLTVILQSANADYVLLIDKLFTKHPGTYVAISSDSEGRKFIVDSYSLNKYYAEHLAAGEGGNYEIYLKRSIANGISFKAENLDYTSTIPAVYILNDKLKIFEEYNSKGIRFIIQKYCMKLGTGEYRAKPVTDDVLHCLIYIMAENKYVVGFSDYSGSFEIKSTGVILARAKKDHRP
ncbi:MAG: hypothetical protein JKY70_06030 [Mucilaginibacter sp.]|nr:hypothetical protein [Mucilaginibacter sp.]